MVPFVARDLEAGLLVEPLPGRRVRTSGDWNLVCRKETATLDKLVKFREWILREIQKDETMQNNLNREEPESITPRALSAI